MVTSTSTVGRGFAPGSVVVVRDEEWLVTATEQTAGGLLVYGQGLSELVRDTTACFYDTLDEIETMLNPDQFYRASRHCLVNINAVQSVKGLANLKLQLVLKTPNHQVSIDISRDKAPSFKKWLEK